MRGSCRFLFFVSRVLVPIIDEHLFVKLHPLFAFLRQVLLSGKELAVGELDLGHKLIFFKFAV